MDRYEPPSAFLKSSEDQRFGYDGHLRNTLGHGSPLLGW
jgi:hypothetical protein